jgi:hypothetical protein
VAPAGVARACFVYCTDSSDEQETEVSKNFQNLPENLLKIFQRPSQKGIRCTRKFISLPRAMPKKSKSTFKMSIEKLSLNFEVLHLPRICLCFTPSF